MQVRRPQRTVQQTSGIVAAYCRVSSKSQDYPTQRHAIERAAAARGDTVSLWYSEKKSAKTIARPELDRLRADARAGKVAKLYVFKLDRVARSGIRDTLEVVEELRAHGCELVSVADGFDLTGAVGEIVLCVMAWAAKMERLATNERIAAARARVEAEGGSWGRPRSLNDAQVAQAVQLRKDGCSLSEIASEVGVSKTTVLRMLRAAA